jgi:hypothetical protein
METTSASNVEEGQSARQNVKCGNGYIRKRMDKDKIANMQPTVIHTKQGGSKEALKDKKAEKKMKRLMEYLKGVQTESFTGYIKINFSQGSVGRVERFEEVLKK